MISFRRSTLPLLAVLVVAGSSRASETTMPEVLPEMPIWQGNTLTPEQPFPARVKAISGSWVGYTLLLEEITDQKPGRSCLATLGHQQINYTILSAAECHRRMQHPHMHSTFFEAPVQVNKFRFENGLYKLGHPFGKDDLLRQTYR